MWWDSSWITWDKISLVIYRRSTVIVLVLVICINIFAVEPNLHIYQMTSLAYKLLDDVINMHDL